VALQGKADGLRADAARAVEHALGREQGASHVDGKDVAEAAHPRLRSEVEDAVDAVEIELVLREVEPAHVEPTRIPLFLGEVVVVREAVDADNVVSRLAERLGEVRANEAGGPRDDVSHRGTIP